MTLSGTSIFRGADQQLAPGVTLSPQEAAGLGAAKLACVAGRGQQSCWSSEEHHSQFPGTLCSQQQPHRVHQACSVLYICSLSSFSVCSSHFSRRTHLNQTQHKDERRFCCIQKRTESHCKMRLAFPQLKEERGCLFSLVIRKMSKHEWAPYSGNKYLLFIIPSAQTQAWFRTGGLQDVCFHYAIFLAYSRAKSPRLGYSCHKILESFRLEKTSRIIRSNL